MKQWLFILFLSIAFVANSSAAMLMPVQMLSTTPAQTTAAMPCHQVQHDTGAIDKAQQAKAADTKSSHKHCPGCMSVGHAIPGDGCSSCSCVNLSSVLSPEVELIPLSSPHSEYCGHYLTRFTSIPPRPLLRPPQTL